MAFREAYMRVNLVSVSEKLSSPEGTRGGFGKGLMRRG